MPEPRRVAAVLVSLEDLTERLGLMKFGELHHVATDRMREGGTVYLGGDWSRGGQPPKLTRTPGEIAQAVDMPPGLAIVEAYTLKIAFMAADIRRGALEVVLKVEGASLPPVMGGQQLERYVVEVEEVPQPADLPSQRRGRLVAA